MDQATKDQLTAEVGLTSTYMDTTLDNAVTGTPWATAAQTGESVFYTIIATLFRKPWEQFLAAFQAILPGLFASHATGTWLDQHANDYTLTRGTGRKAQITVTLTKDSATLLLVPAGTVFHVNEIAPRKFLADQEYTAQSGVTTLDVVAEAEAVGANYNVAAGLVTESETVLPVTAITNASAVPVVSGIDPEDDATLRARVLAAKGAESFEIGVDPYYVRILKTAANVVDATLDSVNASTATIYYTIYGSGSLAASDVTAAQTLIDSKKMLTDTIVVTAATAHTLALTVEIRGTYVQQQILDSVAAFFSDYPRSTDFEASPLIHHLHEQFEDIEALRVSPDTHTLPTGNYYVPSTTVQVLP